MTNFTTSYLIFRENTGWHFIQITESSARRLAQISRSLIYLLREWVCVLRPTNSLDHMETGLQRGVSSDRLEEPRIELGTPPPPPRVHFRQKANGKFKQLQNFVGTLRVNLYIPLIKISPAEQIKNVYCESSYKTSSVAGLHSDSYRFFLWMDNSEATDQPASPTSWFGSTLAVKEATSWLSMT